ncbi:MAG: divalent metal cation transporter [Verrucomicrobia bacterium]|nr:divalent metal cation transporter [Verrucomicrobiota bacterium]
MSEENDQKGLPMTSKWDPEILAKEVAELNALEAAPFGTKVKGYLKRSGPGLLQSAMTLGAGSAAASIVAGAYYGYSLLWVQPLAMFLGIMMLGALGKVVLTSGERPYKAFGREINKPLIFLWAFGTVMASVIWHFPQYGLAAGAARDLVDLTMQTPGVSSVTANADGLTGIGFAASWGIGLLILGINVCATWNYGKDAKGIKVYEWFLRTTIAIVVIMFGAVVVKTGINMDLLKEGNFGFGWPTTAKGVTTVLGAIGAAVGINMTFLYPYTLLAKGWGKSHRKLMRWDLALSMFLPFVVVTSLIIIAMANTVYPLDPSTPLKPLDAAQALIQTMGPAGRLIFDLGFIAMTCGAISTHMVVCGFTICEMFGLEYTTKRFRMFALVPAIGILGVITNTPMWMPVAASAVCLTMLPIAYVIFFIMNNKRSYIGDAVGTGWRRALVNIILLIAIAMATIGAAIKIKGGVIDKIPALIGKEQPAGQK